MALIRSDSGCKVGWLTFDNEAEAIEAGKRARVEAREMASRGYDFGYQSPGSVTQCRKDGVLVEEWTVVTP